MVRSVVPVAFRTFVPRWNNSRKSSRNFCEKYAYTKKKYMIIYHHSYLLIIYHRIA